MQRNAIEPILGALVLAAAASFLFFAYQKAGQRPFTVGYPLTARFSAVDGLTTGSDVRIGGVKVGQVTEISLDPKTYLAMVKLSINPKVKVPDDSVASVASEGLIGVTYLGLLPGSSDDMLKPGARIDHTQAPFSLMELISQYMYSQQGGSKSSSNGGGNAQPAAPAPSPAHP